MTATRQKLVLAAITLSISDPAEKITLSNTAPLPHLRKCTLHQMSSLGKGMYSARCESDRIDRITFQKPYHPFVVMEL